MAIEVNRRYHPNWTSSTHSAAVPDATFSTPRGSISDILPMNAKLSFVLSLAIALMPIGSAIAQGRRAAAATSRPSAVARSGPQFRGGTFRGPAFRGASGPAQRYNWGASRSFSAVNRTGFTGTRTAINRNATNWNRFNTATIGTNRFGTNRFGSGFNRSGDWWRHRQNNNFIFFGAFGFPFFWDFWYPSAYYGAYYPYYDYTPYYYDPYSYGYGYGYPNYPVYGNGGDSGYSNDYAYTDPNNNNRDRGGAGDTSVVSQVQEQLAKDGYYKGSIDGVAGSRTYYAIRAYQRDHHLRANGQITDDLLQEMGLR
jgi:hypothetical protein